MRIPLRTCAATGQRLPQGQLLRFTNVGGVPTPDPLRRAAGRGAYLLPTEENLTLATRKKVFAHRLGTHTPPPPWPEIKALLDTTGFWRQEGG